MTLAGNMEPALPRQIPVAVLGGCAFAAVLVMLAFPRAAHVAYAVLALLAGLGLWQRGGIGAAFRLDAGALLWVALLGYLGLSLAWSQDAKGALPKIALLAAYAGLLRLALAGLAGESERVIGRLGRSVAWAALVGAGFICFQVLTDQAFTTLLLKISPKLGPDLKHLQVVNGQVAHANDYVINRNCAALSVLLWPALAMLTRFGKAGMARFLALGLFALAGVAILRSPHETSQLALIFSAAVFALAWLAPAAARRLVMAGWMLATLAVVPIALLAFRADLHHAMKIPESGRARIILWNYTAEQTLKAPLLGTGVGSTEAISARHMRTAERPEGFVYPLDTGRHSHDVYLQTWFELGAVGAVFLLLLGLGPLGWIARQPELFQPYALAAFTSAATIAAFSYGVWQEWFEALFFASIVATRLAGEFVGRGNAKQ